MINIKERFKNLKEANLPNSSEMAKKHKHNEIIKLFYNENKFGPSSKIKESIKIKSPHIYPEFKEPTLIRKLKSLYHLDVEYFYVSNGSDAILDSIPTLFASKTNKQNIIVPKLTFARIATTCEVNGLEVKKIELKNNKIDLQKTLEAIDKDTAIIYIVNPNMPTGTFYNHKEVIKFLYKVPSNILVVIDEAYIEYSKGFDKTFLDDKEIIEKFDNVIITHTFSKVFGLASFRIGYMISRPYIVNVFRKAYQYLPINKYSLQAGVAALSDLNYYNDVINKTNIEKDKYYEIFEELKFDYEKSYGNFIFVKMPRNHEFDLYLLKNYGVKIRAIGDTHFRITIGTPKENKLVFKALREFYV